jgi:hypothetical protein
MRRQHRQDGSPVRSIGPIADRRRAITRRVGSPAVRDRTSGRYDMGSNSITREPVKREPGATLELLFHQNPDLKPGPFLACAEQNFRMLGDLEALREIRAYRAKHGR